MPRVVFDPKTISFDFSNSQIGEGKIAFFAPANPNVIYQHGFGRMISVRRQRGKGLGTIVRTIWTFLKPLAAHAKPIAAGIGKAIGQEALATTGNFLDI